VLEAFGIIWEQENFTASGKSFMYKTNRRGPRILPCGTPDSTRRRQELQWFIDTNWFLLWYKL